MIEKIIEKIKSYNAKADLDIVRKAYKYAEEAHSDAPLRLSGESFFIHPYHVALILADLNMDVSTIAAGFLHDVIEDTDKTYDDIKKEFGEEIANLVDGVTKLSKVKYSNKEERQAESLRKMIIAMSKDIRVVIIKLCDRLHNIRTLEYMIEEKQKTKAIETIEIYAPIANRLGMASIRSELEDLSLKYIDPKGYNNLVEIVNKKRKEREKYIKEIINITNENLTNSGIESEIKGRHKGFYSIYRKMHYKNKPFEEIYDITAIRIIVDSVRDCYGSLGIVHTLWKPIPGRFKDYIAMPKPNMYQSLHTTVIGTNGEPFEIQIRTWEMHRTAEYGIAAHWKYKEGVNKSDNLDEKFNWLRQMLEWQQETSDPIEFMENLKIDLYTDEVFVFTPKGDVVNLPAGSTPIDFAYRVHSAVGNRCVGSKVNGRIVPLDFKLKNGNQLEILTSAHSNGPSKDWLKIAKSSQARAKIRKFFKDRDKNSNIEKGKELIEKEVKRQGYQLTELLKEDWLKKTTEKFNFNSLDNMFATVGHGGITEVQIVSKLKNIYIEKNKDKIQLEKIDEVNKDKKIYKPISGVIIKGIDNIKVRFSKCCNPVPGDEIVGYITRGRGVSIHKKNCSNINELNNEGRFIEVEWDTNKKISFLSAIQIKALDKPGLLQEVTKLYTEKKFSAVSLNLRINKERLAIIDITLEIYETNQLYELIKKIKRIDGVIDVYRTQK